MGALGFAPPQGLGSGGASFTGGAITSPITGANGTAAAPTYSFTGDATTGLYDTGTTGVIGLGNGFVRLNLGGTTASFPALKRNSTAVNFRLADDSADCAVTCGAVSHSGLGVAQNAGGSLLFEQWGNGCTLNGMYTHAAGTFGFSSAVNNASSTPDAFVSRRAAAGVVGLSNGANPCSWRVFNTADTNADALTNAEWLELLWSSNVCKIQVNQSGTGTARGLVISPNGSGAGNGQTLSIDSASELLTLNTGATTTDTAANLLPAGAMILAVDCRITTTITTAANWTVGDATTAARFSAANSTLTAGTTSIGITQLGATGAASSLQTAAAKVRITTNVNPGAGVIRITVHYVVFGAPTS